VPLNLRQRSGRALQVTEDLASIPAARPVSVGQYQGECLIRKRRELLAQKALFQRMLASPFEITKED
jgi:hypothetical protein